MTKIYHNPRCSKSRAALELLQSRGVEVQVVRYLETPPDANELKKIVQMLGMRPDAIVRRSEKLFKELGLDRKEITDSQWIDILSQNPKLIERPIVVHGGKAAIGRPIENVEKLLDG